MRVLKFRKLLAPHVLNGEVLCRGGGVQREGERFDVSVHVPAAATRVLIRIGAVWPWGRHARKRHHYSHCPPGPSTSASTDVLSESP